MHQSCSGQVEGMGFCINCGTQLVDGEHQVGLISLVGTDVCVLRRVPGARFCNSCGAAQGAPAAVQTQPVAQQYGAAAQTFVPVSTSAPAAARPAAGIMQPQQLQQQQNLFAGGGGAPAAGA